MNLSWPPELVSFLGPALALMLLLGAVAQACGLKPRGPRWCLALALVSSAVVLAPVDGLPLGRWLAGIMDHWSVPLLALLVSAVGRRYLGTELLRQADRQAAWVFGAVAGAVLYPLALGWGSIDPFGLGWHFGPLFAGMTLLTCILLWRSNRFGVVLVIAIAAWHLGVPESGNYWDCLLDPVYFVASLGALVLGLVRAAGRVRPAN